MFKNILIIGFGMIGSSIARTVLKKNKSIKIFAFDKSPNLKIRINKSKLKRVKNLPVLGMKFGAKFSLPARAGNGSWG